MGENLSNENIVHISKNGVEYLQFRKLLEYSDKIEHCYTIRPLDFRIKNENILEEYQKICKALNLDENNIYRPHQTHSLNIEKVDNKKSGIHTEELKNIDGLITKEKNKILSLTYADCIALYFYDPVKNVIGNVHSGWRGTYGEIAKIAVRKLKSEYGIKAENLICRNSAKYKRVLFRSR